MSYIESGIPRKVVIAHESPDAHIGAKVGGAAAVALNQSREMYRMGRVVQLIGPRNGGKDNIDIPHELFEMPELKNNDELLEVYRSDPWITYWEKALKGDSEGKECDVYGHYYVTGGIINELNGLIRGKKIYMGHSWDRVVQRMDPDRVLTPKRALAEASILNNADAIMVSTEAERNMLGGDYQDVVFGGEKAILDKTHVVPLGLDKDTFAPENLAQKRQKHREGLLHGFLKDTLNFYMVGRIAPQKNQLMAVEAFAEALKVDPKLNISLSVFGGPLEGSYYRMIEDFLAAQPSYIQDRVKFHNVMDADVAHAVGDIFLGPSIWETFFLAAAEAMASGKPTIISNKPILREVVGDGTSFVDETNLGDIVSNIQRMATNAELRQYSSDYNLSRAWERYTWKKSARRLDEVWQKLRQ